MIESGFMCACSCHPYAFNQEQQDEIQEDTTSMEEKLEALEKLK